MKSLPKEHIYLVGGAVRDRLLGRPVTEKDWVVTGHNAADMINAGFQQVGRDFPVFLHPTTREEYALARTERKTHQGHTGFVCHTDPSVTLEQDLMRRDLTINAIAQDHENHIIDPYHGQQDLEARILRHVSSAFVEDPLRVLRVARFAAQLSEYSFTIAPETLALMQEISASDELQALPKERIWQECCKALSSPNPAKFFEVLHQAHALQQLWIATDQLDTPALQAATKLSGKATLRFAAACHCHADLANSFPAPNHFQKLARITIQHSSEAMAYTTPQQQLDIMYAVDAWRQSERFIDWLIVTEAIAQSQNQIFDRLNWEQTYLTCATISAKDVDTQLTGPAIAAAIYQKRLEQIST